MIFYRIIGAHVLCRERKRRDQIMREKIESRTKPDQNKEPPAVEAGGDVAERVRQAMR